MLLLLLACADGNIKLADDDTAADVTDDTGTTPADDTGTTDTGDTTADPRWDPVKAAIRADLDASLATAASIAISKDGVLLWSWAAGTRDPDAEIPVDSTTLFQIGSTTKMMTATALLQKVDAGLVGLDTTVDAALPDFEFLLTPEWDDTATLHQLLSHQGGLYDWLDWAGSADDTELQSITNGFYAEYLWAMNPAGEFWNYSNPNFVLAGAVAERLDTRFYPDLMVEDVFRPLGMDRSFLRRTEVEADGDYALGYGYGMSDVGSNRWTEGRVALEDVPDPGWARPAGLAWSTPTQMLAFADFLMHGHLAVLSEDSRLALVSAQTGFDYPNPYDGNYGYGLMVYPGFNAGSDYYAVPLWEHGGNTLSYTSAFYLLPEQDCAISILSNGYGDSFGQSVLAAMTAACDLPGPAAAPPADPIDPAAMSAHVGTHNDAYNVGEMVVTLEPDGLHVDFPFLNQLGYRVDSLLYQVSDDLYYVTIDGAQYDLTFIDGNDGTISLYARNRAFVMTRVAEDTPVEDPPPPPPNLGIGNGFDRIAFDAALRRARVAGPVGRAPAR